MSHPRSRCDHTSCGATPRPTFRRVYDLEPAEMIAPTQNAPSLPHRAGRVMLLYGTAVAAVGLATALRFAAGTWLIDPDHLFLAAISLVAWRAGIGPAGFAVLLSAL